ncbi:MAG: cellulase family glycosylhydrolase [Clostridia bacterium]|nr:cellulase family glycosylhydrolase [Clostridia bacterium]
MKKIFRQTVSLLLIAAALFSLCFPVSAADTQQDSIQGFTDEDFLKTNGQKIVNQKGEAIRLKGVNLGAWMIWEGWLCPYEDDLDHYTVLEKLTERFGEEGAYELFNTYMDNWITEADLDTIKELGFNCVRVPFWYRNFYYDDNGRKILDENGEWDFSRLEWVVEECSKREIYVVLDMHGAVGYQSDAPHSGKGHSVGLYADTEQGERYRELTDELWTEIATRFRDEPAVAMYDLLNEPMCDVEATEFERRKNNEMIYTRLYDTIRAVDSEHIITMEAIWTAIALPLAWTKGWENVVYQVHFYNNSNFIFNFFAWVTKFIYSDVPMMMGEFYPHQKTTWENCFKTLNKADYSWFLWTYKATGHGMWSSDWCLRGSKNGFERVNVETDSYEEIARKWGTCLRTENGFQDTGHYEANVKDYI